MGLREAYLLTHIVSIQYCTYFNVAEGCAVTTKLNLHFREYTQDWSPLSICGLGRRRKRHVRYKSLSTTAVIYLLLPLLFLLNLVFRSPSLPSTIRGAAAYGDNCPDRPRQRPDRRTDVRRVSTTMRHRQEREGVTREVPMI